MSAGPERLGGVTQRIVDDLRLRRMTKHLCDMGPRAVAEFLDELSDNEATAERIRLRLEVYSRLNPETVAALGGRDFAPIPLHSVTP